jgi:hypothetical protein
MKFPAERISRHESSSTLVAVPAPVAGGARLVMPRSFDPARHYYPGVLGRSVHPEVARFYALDTDAVVARHVRRHPEVDPAALAAALGSQPSVLRWAGADLVYARAADGERRVLLLETNSCPSGQKSMPAGPWADGGYRSLLERAFRPAADAPGGPDGALAVLADKNPMETSGYAAAMADLYDEPVWLVDLPDGHDGTHARFTRDGTLEVRPSVGRWRPIRAAFRYVTKRPWSRIPLRTRTRVVNPVLACLAGARNKLVAARAYAAWNAAHGARGLAVHTPETFVDVPLAAVADRVRALGGRAVVKVPYGNAGQGVHTILCEAELRDFLARAHRYGRFIVQELVGHAPWGAQRWSHVGTAPDAAGRVYATDLRMMVAAGPGGFRPQAVYARRAEAPLADALAPGASSWEMLGTNLSVRRERSVWQTEADRLIPLDGPGFERLGLGLDDLVDGFVQAALATLAIDAMARGLDRHGEGFDRAAFRALNDDAQLLGEIPAWT